MDVENQPAAEASKTCIACGITKPTSAFTPSRECKMGVLPRCRECMRLVSAAYRAARPEVHRAAVAKWTSANRDRSRAACRSHYERNKEYYRAKSARWHADNPERDKELQAKYRATHAEALRVRWRAWHHDNKDRPLLIVRRRASRRMHAALSGIVECDMHVLGCDSECLRSHIELLFAPGMGWHNTGEWEIDHFYPLSAIGDDPSWWDVRAACNYRNLRPCWRGANRSKRGTVLPEAAELFGCIKDMIAKGLA